VLPLLLFLAVVSGLFLRKLTAEERIQLLRKSIAAIKAAIVQVRQLSGAPAGCEEFDAALRARTRLAFVTPAIVVGLVAFYLMMALGGSGATHEQFLVEWGGNLGPRTTNGEWWRLATAMFIHWGLLHLLAEVVGLSQVGRLMERLVGPVAFAFVFVAAGLISGLRELSVSPVSVTVGAAGGIIGVYGLLIATCAWGWVRRSELTIPLAVLKQLAPGAVIFFVYSIAANGFMTQPMMWGLIVGLAGGGILGFGIDAHKPPVRRLCTSMAATLAVVLLFAAPLRGMADVTREMGSVIALEARTTAAYDAEVAQFRKGRQTAEALANTAEAIAADIRATRATLAAITNVPPEQQPIVTDAREFLRLREESWRLRVDGLRKGKLQTLQQADRVESSAKTLFAKIEGRGVENWKSNR
jgi:membrane associated rhomboid family serine protease